MANTKLYTPAPEVLDVPEVKARPRQRPVDIELRGAREHARRMTEMYGPHARETAAAWDTVEEILAMKAHERAAAKTSFQQYCDDNPDAPEARMYDL